MDKILWVLVFYSINVNNSFHRYIIFNLFLSFFRIVDYLKHLLLHLKIFLIHFNYCILIFYLFNFFRCFDRSMNPMHCFDNIFYVSLIPKFYQKLQCHLMSVFNLKNFGVLSIIIFMVMIIKFYIKRRQISKTETCLMLEKATMCKFL